MSRIYNDSKLTKTSDFFEINYLTQQDIRYWLTHLEQDSGITAFTLTDLSMFFYNFIMSRGKKLEHRVVKYYDKKHNRLLYFILEQ